MTKRMLIDATHPEETRVVVLDGSRLEDYDVETSNKKQLKGNIYLAKIVRVEPSLQAAFVEYGGNRHGFLAFGEIHPDYYQIPVADRLRLLEMQEQQAREEEAADDAAAASMGGHHGHASHLADDLGNDTAADAPAEAFEAGAPARALDIAGDELAIPPPPGEAARPDESGHEPGHEPGDIGADLSPEMVDAAQDDAAEYAADETLAEQALTGELEGGGDARASADAPDSGPDSGSDSGDETGRGVPARFLRNYKIQEVIRRRQIILVQVVKEERGNKGAALTTYISLAGRYSVLMPNSPRGGGVSRKITAVGDRKRLKEVIHELDLPRGMGLIVRTAGANRPKPEIKRDGEYLLRLWDDIRERTLQSTAPSLIYEEASLIKRAIRDVYSRDVDDLLVDGEDGWRAAREFMRMLMPTHASKVVLWQDPSQKLFARHGVEAQLDAMLSPTVQLKSGGYLVINQAEALVAIDVNSGRSTRERNIEETALRTNLEAADEVARQLRLRDLAGLIVIDFIDMEAKKHNAAVERRIKEALKNDRARIQVGHISSFGLLEMSRQRLRPSLAETSFIACPHCGGTGHVRSTETASMHVMRAVEEEAARHRSAEIVVHVAGSIALYILNHKRAWLAGIESRHGMVVAFAADDSLIAPQTRIDRVRAATGEPPRAMSVPIAQGMPPLASATFEPAESADLDDDEAQQGEIAAPATGPAGATETAEEGERRRKRRRRRRGGRRPDGSDAGESEAGESEAGESDAASDAGEDDAAEAQPQAEAGEPGDTATEPGEDSFTPARARRRRGGRRRNRGPDVAADAEPAPPPVIDTPVYAPPPYAGPTPANPFGDQAFDIFDVIEQQLLAGEAAAPAAAPEAEAVPQTAPEPAPEPAFEPVPEPVAETVAEAAPEPIHAPAPVTVAAEPAPEPVPETPPEPAPAVQPTLVGAEGAPEAKKKGWWRK